MASQDECALAARKKKQLAFSYGKGQYAQGTCYTEAVRLTAQQYEAWSLDRKGPSCPNGGWYSNPFYDTYAIKPVGAA